MLRNLLFVTLAIAIGIVLSLVEKTDVLQTPGQTNSDDTRGLTVIPGPAVAEGFAGEVNQLRVEDVKQTRAYPAEIPKNIPEQTPSPASVTQYSPTSPAMRLGPDFDPEAEYVVDDNITEQSVGENLDPESPTIYKTAGTFRTKPESIGEHIDLFE
jgi:hypothetical protein